MVKRKRKEQFLGVKITKEMIKQVDKKEEIWTVMKKIEMNHTRRSAN